MALVWNMPSPIGSSLNTRCLSGVRKVRGQRHGTYPRRCKANHSSLNSFKMSMSFKATLSHEYWVAMSYP